MFFRKEKICSSTRVQQGDPIASLIFCLAIQPVVLRIQQEVPDLVLNSWFMDDRVQLGELHKLQQVVNILTEEGFRGIYLYTLQTTPQPKYLGWRQGMNPNVPGPLEQGIPASHKEGIVHLGSPIGSLRFI